MRKKFPLNTNTNTIRFQKISRIRIRILFGLKKSTEYEYEYYSVWKNQPNTNTNTIRFEKINRIRIRIPVFGLNYSNNIRIPNYSLTSDLMIPNCVCVFVYFVVYLTLYFVVFGIFVMKRHTHHDNREARYILPSFLIPG